MFSFFDEILVLWPNILLQYKNSFLLHAAVDIFKIISNSIKSVYRYDSICLKYHFIYFCRIRLTTRLYHRVYFLILETKTSTKFDISRQRRNMFFSSVPIIIWYSHVFKVVLYCWCTCIVYIHIRLTKGRRLVIRISSKLTIFEKNAKLRSKRKYLNSYTISIKHDRINKPLIKWEKTFIRLWNGLGIIYQYDTQQSYAIATLTILMHVIDMGYLQRKEIRRVRANTKWNILLFIF